MTHNYPIIVTHIAPNRASFEIPIYMFSAKHFNRMKRIFTALISTVLFATTAFAQIPANDNCTGAIVLTPTPVNGTCPTTIYTNVNATDAPIGQERNPDCFNGLIAHKDVWFKFKTAIGSNINYRITITGVSAADSIKSPQIALYTGDCAVGLFKEYCASKDVGTPDGKSITLDAGCMRQGTDYFLQVADYKSNNTGGRFTVCVTPIVDPTYVMQATPQTTTVCEGTLYDSGGPLSNYKINEKDFTFNIKPIGKGCFEVKVDSFSTESNYDTLTIFNKDGLLLDKISGLTNRPVVFQATTSALKVVFNSDASNVARGFKLTWKTKDFCDAPAPTTCTAPEIIPSLPFSVNATNCNDAISTITTSPCPVADNDFLGGKDHVYKFSSAGGQCVRVVLSDIPAFTGGTGINVGLYRNCPSDAGSECIATGKLNTLKDSSIIKNVSLTVAGDYYLVVSSREACTSYKLQMDSIPCLNILPNAGFCASALPLSGCSNQSPSNVQVDLSVQGDLSFMDFTTPQYSGNRGCINTYGGTPPRANFTFLKFKAQANGKFGFMLGPTVPSVVDIDFNVYGPIDNEADICTFAKTNAPARSSWASSFTGPGNSLTGLADSYRTPAGTLVNVDDDLDCGLTGTTDGVVRRMDVIKDKFYLIWINDYTGVIGRDGVRLDFTSTSDNILDNGNANAPLIAGRDTAICIGRSTPLLAQGGLTYKWTPAASLNRDTIANPIATPSVSTAYNVTIQATCRAVAKKVSVLVFNVKDIPNQTVCRNEDLVFNAGEVYPSSTGAVWSWTSSTNHLSELSCLNCPNPTFKATGAAGAHIFTATLTTPACVLTKTVTITVTANAAPVYNVVTSATPTRDTNVCVVGPAFNLLKAGFDPTATYTWASVPTSTLSGSNPSVLPTSSLKYYVSVTGGAGGCTAVSTDSVIVNVFQLPVLNTITDTALCRDLVISMGKTAVEANTTYSWNNTNGFDNPSAVNPNLTVRTGVTNYTLTARNIGGCSVSKTIKVTGIDLRMRIDTPAPVKICRGTPLVLSSIVTPSNARVKWSSNRDFSLPLDSTTAKITVNPITRSRYYADVSLGNCRRIDSVDVFVDSLPTPMIREILPKDTTVCIGTIILFRSTVFEPIFYPTLKFKWTPAAGQITADSFYNLVITADTARKFYVRVATNGACVAADTVKLTVNPIPTLVLAPRDTFFCAPPTPVRMTVTTPNQNVMGYKWKVNGQDDDNGKDKTFLVVNPTVGTTTITVSAKIGDCPASTTTTIKVNPLPTVAFPQDPNNILCANAPVPITLNSAPNTGFTYAWTGPGLAVPTTAAAPSVSPTVDNSKYVVVIKNTATGCTKTDSTTLRVATGSLATIPETNVCSGNPNPTITAVGTSNIGAVTYSWTPTTGVTTNGASITVPSSVSTTYTVTYTYGNNCKTTAMAKVNALSGFSLAVTASPDSVLRKLVDQGTSVTLTASGSGNVGTGLTYTWKTDAATTSGAVITFKALEDVTYKLSAVAPSTCTKDTTVKIAIRYPNYKLANAFTPNGDTINSYFGPIFTGLFPFSANDPRPTFWKGRIEVVSFQVFNRWGQEVYGESTSAVLNATAYKGWNGKKDGKDDGSEQASDVYVYVIKLKMPDDSIKIESGELNLIR